MSSPSKVLVIGGGFTGLTAAWRLAADRNLAVTLVESAAQLGGLAAGFRLAGNSLEKTYHHLFLTDRSILNLVNELGISDKLQWWDSSVGIYRAGRIYPFKTPLDLLRFQPCSLAGRVRTGFAALYLKHLNNWRGLAPQTAENWMRRACGDSAMKSIWSPLLRGKFAEHDQHVSMAWFWARIHTRANSRSGSGGEKLGYFKGGFNVVVSALEKELLLRGVTIRTGVTVEALTADNTAVIAGESVAFDACLFTGPSPAFARLLPANHQAGDYAAKLKSIDYLGAICLVFTSTQNLGQFYWVNVNEDDAPFLVFLNHTQLVDKEAYGGHYVYYIGTYLAPNGPVFSQTDAALTESWFAYLKKMFPEFDAGCVQERNVFRFRAAQHIVDTRYAEKISGYRTPLPGVYLANFSQIFPEDRGTNFAVREGEKIAALIRQDLADSAGPVRG